MPNIMRVGGGGGKSNKPMASLLPTVDITKYRNGVADLDAESLNLICYAISNNTEIGENTSVVYYDFGDMHRKISVGDTLDNFIGDATYTLKIIGFNHDTLANNNSYAAPTATGKAGMTIQIVDCLPSKWAMNTSATNAGGWETCNMRATYMPYIEERLPEAIRSVVKTVKKLTSAGNQSTTINATEDKLFLLAEGEIFDSITYSATGEGIQYTYYKAGNSKVKAVKGTADKWWLRSPYKSGAHIVFVTATGTANVDSANATLGVAFAYCI